MTPPGYYSPHFAKLEMVASESAARYGIDNACPALLEPNLERLCKDFLEPIRFQFGPVRVTSAYRCPQVNALVGGSVTSAHMQARAADVQFLRQGATLKRVAHWLINDSKLPFDQCILEFNSWIHVGIAAVDAQPRRQALMVFHGGGYLPFNPKDPRVNT